MAMKIILISTVLQYLEGFPKDENFPRMHDPAIESSCDKKKLELGSMFLLIFLSE